MKDLMEKGYDKEIDLYGKDITSHYHCKASTHIRLLDHDTVKFFMLCTFHDKVAPTITPLAPFQAYLQKNIEKCIHDNFQVRNQLLQLKSQNLKLDSFHVFHIDYLQ